MKRHAAEMLAYCSEVSTVLGIMTCVDLLLALGFQHTQYHEQSRRQSTCVDVLRRVHEEARSRNAGVLF
jgi:hypothetical protein